MEGERELPIPLDQLSDSELLSRYEARFPDEMGVVVDILAEQPIAWSPDGTIPIYPSESSSRPGKGSARIVWPLKEDIIPEHENYTKAVPEQLSLDDPSITRFSERLGQRTPQALSTNEAQEIGKEKYPRISNDK